MANHSSTTGGSGRANRFENRKGVSCINEEHLGYGEKADYVDTKVRTTCPSCSIVLLVRRCRT